MRTVKSISCKCNYMHDGDNEEVTIATREKFRGKCFAVL